MHTTADDPKRYREDEEVEDWRRKDPITRFEIYLKRRRLLTKAKIAAIAQEILEEIQTAVDAAEAKMQTIGDPLAMFEHAYADITPEVQAQRDAFRAEQAAAAREGSDA